ncbi:MAG: OmpH family outer membrane protein [Bergeyella zoohelcum]|nr:OmpH family outer membrane protein [Bergeyella zoohelcum]
MKKLSVLFAAVAMFASVGLAKAQKVATLDLAGILNVMPEKKKADEQLEAYAKTKGADIEKQEKALQAEVEAYQKEAGKLTEAQRTAKEQELQKKIQGLQQIQQVAQKDLAEKQTSLYAPIEKKLNETIKKVADANGWEFVLDAANPAIIYKNGADATPAVKKELGL